jgi:hypothetical protein
LVILPEAPEMCEQAAKGPGPVVFIFPAGKWPVRQRSLFSDLIYSSIVLFFIGVHEIATLSFASFHQGKEESQSAATERRQAQCVKGLTTRQASVLANLSFRPKGEIYTHAQSATCPCIDFSYRRNDRDAYITVSVDSTFCW